MTRTLDRLIEEFLRGLIIAEVDPRVNVQVSTNLLGEGEAMATLPRIVIECQSQETPEFFSVGVHRITTTITSVAEASSPVSSDDLEDMNAAVDRVIVFGDNLPALLTTSSVVTHGIVYGGETQNQRKNRLIRTRNATIWARLLNADALSTGIDYGVDSVTYIYIREGATGAGTTWTDALAQLPATFIRGNTYYVADGTYDGFNVNTALSGTDRITIKKAITTDHGTSTGWSNSYGDGVAIFTSGIGIQKAYVTIDGSYEYGFECVVPDSQSGIVLWATDAADQNGIEIKYCDIHSTHTMPHNFDVDCLGIYVHPWSGAVYSNTYNLLISHCKIHAVSTMMQVLQCFDMVIEYCKIYDNRVVDATYNPGTMAHPNILFLENSSRTTFRYNEIWNTVAVGLFPAYTGAGFYIYGNFFHDILGYSIFFYDPGTYSNARIYNNTFVRTNWGPIWDNNNLSDAIANNNIFYQYTDSPNYGHFTHDYNWYTGTGATSFGEPHGINGGAGNPFTTEPNIVSTVSSTMPCNKGQTLAAPYNVDMNGNIRGADGSWDIGAIEE